MSIFKKLVGGKEKRRVSASEISNVSAWGTGITVPLASTSYPMLLSTVYRCVDLISDSLAVLPLLTYKIDKDGFKSLMNNHPAFNLLNSAPNSDMTRATFMKVMMTSVLLTGNAYAYISRDANLQVQEIIYIPSSKVTIEWVANNTLVRQKMYRVSGFSELVDPFDMIHVLNFSYDGILGVSTLTHARQTLGIATDSEAQVKGFFENGAATSGVLTLTGPPLTKEQKDGIYETWASRTQSHPGGVAVLEGNMTYQPITISPKDSQLLESREFNVIDICRFFSVSPVKAFDLSKSSYSTVEATQLQYLSDTVLPVITKFELEINRKVFLPSEQRTIRCEYDTSVMLRADKAAQGNFYREMFNIGAVTPNEIRREINLSRIEGGDEAFVQVNTVTLKSAVQEKKEPEPAPAPDLSDNLNI